MGNFTCAGRPAAALAAAIGPPRRIPSVARPPAAAAPARGCADCASNDACALSHDLRRNPLDGLLTARRRVRKGQVLYRENDPLHVVYAVRVGTFKTEITLGAGQQQVTGFPMAGDPLGFDGFAWGVHASTASALEDSEACFVSAAQLADTASADGDARAARLQQLAALELLRSREQLMLIANRHSHARLAAFLLKLSARLRERGFSGTDLQLRMSRAEIGNYLGMTLETVSRTLSQFARQACVDVHKRHVRLLDPAGLQAICESSGLPLRPAGDPPPGWAPHTSPALRALHQMLRSQA